MQLLLTSPDTCQSHLDALKSYLLDLHLVQGILPDLVNELAKLNDGSRVFLLCFQQARF